MSIYQPDERDDRHAVEDELRQSWEDSGFADDVRQTMHAEEHGLPNLRRLRRIR